MYGLLDASVQLGQINGPGYVARGLQKSLERIAFESPDEDFRRKAVGSSHGPVLISPKLMDYLA